MENNQKIVPEQLSKPKCHENELFGIIATKNELCFGCEICLMSMVKKKKRRVNLQKWIK